MHLTLHEYFLNSLRHKKCSCDKKYNKNPELIKELSAQ
jgi:hypothetical protein